MHNSGHNSAKERYNQLSKDLAYEGSFLCRARQTMIFFEPSYGLPVGGGMKSWKIVRVLAGEYFLILRGPLPSGQHKKSFSAGCWLLYTKNGPAYSRSHPDPLVFSVKV